ncbi:MAG: TonB-dependent receptor [Bacteroidales bacterium]|nr:TonB-dependent receptor [Bacteroidales bacterium]
MYSGLSFNHKQQFGNLDLVIGGNNTCDEGYRINDYKQNTRFNVNTRYRFKKVEGLSVGFNSNFMATIKSDFFNYASDTTPFLPNPNVSMVFPTHGFRFNFDPFVYYYSPRDGGRYSLRTRYFRTNNINSDESKSSTSDTYYAEFQYNNTFAKRWIVTAGIVESYSKVYANLFGNHTANNTSLYAQLDAKFNRLKISLGLRGEYFMLDSEHSETAVKNFPIRPVARVGLNYELTEKTFIRASIGQGYRFPSISEKYTSTDLGGAAIHPNPNALPETGWNTEIGLKQGFNISSNWKGFADFSIYHQQMHNMLEFSFGIFDHNTGKEVPLILDSLDAIDTLEIGFIAKNMNDVMISGFDISTGIVGKINRATLSATLSYSYNYPLHKDGADETASTTTNLLKYRFKHSIKADFQIDAKRLIAGLSVEWKSAIKNVDRIFCDERDLADLSTEQDIAYYFYGELLSNQVLIPGYWNYRKENAKKTFLNIDVNFGFNFSHNVKAVFVVRNLLNQTFSGRPADICAPRRYEVMVTYKFN